KAWLAAIPQVEVITRDHWPAYIQAATTAAPQAKQVADRFHLLMNVREAVEKVLSRVAPDIRAANAAVNALTEAPPRRPHPPRRRLRRRRNPLYNRRPMAGRQAGDSGQAVPAGAVREPLV